MSNFAKRLIPYLLVLMLTSCLFDSDTDTIVDDYEVGWNDVTESRDLSKHEQLVPAYVFAVGHDSKFIFAKQHPVKPNSSEKIDQTITNYYIIQRTKNYFQDKPKYGPLTKTGFDSLCLELRIKNVAFDVTYPTKF